MGAVSCKTSRQTLSRLQESRLRRTVRLAYRKTRLYREAMDGAGLKPEDIRGYDDLVKLPFLSKAELSKDHLAATADRVSVWHTTSGTTGQPCIIGFSEKDLETQTMMEARNLKTIGVSSRDVVQNVTPYGMFFAGICIHEGIRRLGATVVPAGKTPTSWQHAKFIETFKPTVIVGIPQFILKLSYIYEENTGRPSEEAGVKRIYAIGEPLPMSVRQRLEEKWRADVYAGYGLTEVGSGAECELHLGVHWCEDCAYTEVVDPETGERVGWGEPGELVYTSLTRTGTMVIRFRSRDFSRVFKDECQCGRTFMRIMPPEHRLDDLVKVKGVLTNPCALDDALFSFPEVRNYLCIIDKDERGADEVRLYIESARQDSAFQSALKENLVGRSWFSPSHVKYVPPGKIPNIGRKGVRLIDLRSGSTYMEEAAQFLREVESA